MNTDELLITAGDHFNAGRLGQAEGICRGILATQPNSSDAIQLLGAIAGRLGRHDIAADLSSRAIALEPDRPELYFNLIFALAAQDRVDQALSAYGQMEKLGAHRLDLLNGLALSLQQRGRLDEAITTFERVLAIQPDDFNTLNHISLALRDKGDLDRALDCCRRAVGQRPDSTDALVNLGGLLAADGQMSQAMAAIDQAVALKPDLAIARRNRGQLRLLSGDLEGGWPEFEWRWRVGDSELGTTLLQPCWDGSALHGQTIMLYTEQGLGDAMQFVRYAPLVAQRGGQIVLACRPALLELFRTVAGISEVVDGDQFVPRFDVACPLLNLPGVFKTNLANIPATVPYILADPTKAAGWRERLGTQPGLKVGLVWAGGKAHQRDAYRSISLSALARLATLPNVVFFSLQKGDAAADAKSPPPGLKLIDLGGELNDFADTAAVMENLDLIISVDTAVAHLAGAMGKRVWVLIPFAPDWRWMLNRTDSPWYPTMRLFRQPRRGDWEAPIGQIVEEMLKF